jgi:FixJ family two-component response regulator
VKTEKQTNNMAGRADTAVISIVEDDASVREAMGNLMKATGYQTVAFESGEAFLGFSETVETACLILDVRMPGMNGLDLQRRLALSGNRTPIVFVTAHMNDYTRRQALQAGAVAFLRKPVSEADLLSAVGAAFKPSPKQTPSLKIK